MSILTLNGGRVYLRVVFLPGGTGRSVVVFGTFSKTTVLLAFGGETAGFTVFVDGVGDPVDSGVAADGLVLGATRFDR